MTLLSEIIEAATDSKAPLSDLLRRCKILGVRVKNDLLVTWVDRELDGYADVEALPDYRVQRDIPVLGDMMSLAYRRSNVPIPSLAVSEEHKDGLFTAHFVSGVAEYESLLATGHDEFRMPWPANIVAYYETKIVSEGMLTAAWRVVTAARIGYLLDQIRNRVLAFALEIEREAPNLGEPNAAASSMSPSQIDGYVTNYIFGGNNILASGSHASFNDFEQVGAGDWRALSSTLRSLNLPEDEINALQEAFAEDGTAEGELGPSVQQWVGRITARIGTGALTLTNNATAGVVAGLVLRHLGLT